MSRALLPLAFLVSVTTGELLTWAGEGDTKDVPTEELIGRLGNSDFAEREQATKALQARGPAVLPALRAALKHRDAEVRRRAAELIPTLEAVASVAPKRVTLTGEKRPLSAILKDIEQQTGYRVEEEERNDGVRYSIAMKDVLFWEALERIGRETGCVVVEGGSPSKLRLRKGKTRSPFVFVADSFRVELTSLHEDRDIDFQAPGKDQDVGSRRRRVTLNWSVQAEPRLVIVERGPPQLEIARDQEARPFKNVTREGPIQFEEVAEKARTIKEMRGTIPVQVAVARKDVVATDNFLASKGTKFRVGNYGLEINRAEDENFGSGGCLLTIAGPRLEGFPLCLHNRFHLEDAKGNRYKLSRSNSVELRGETFINFFYAKSENSDLGPPVKVVVEDWTVMRHSIPFVLKDVPLP